jgi:uncharacterized repeat protein (TIGR04138 family)
MQKIDFTEAVDRLTESDPRYHRDAYFFLREALDFTVKLRKRQLGDSGHVNGAQLCEGIRQLAIKQFGPMALTVLEYWGLRRTEDFGDMVWNLIDLGAFGKQDSDSREDFKNVYAFREVFVEPFLPPRPLAGALPLGADVQISGQEATA